MRRPTLAAMVAALAAALVAASCGGGKSSGPPPGDGSGDGGGTGGGGSGSGGGDSGGTTTPSACDGLLAAPGVPRAVRLDVAADQLCSHATSRPDGEVALGTASSATVTNTFVLYPPDGAGQQGSIFGVSPHGARDIAAWFHASGDGWAGIVRTTAPATVPAATPLRAFDVQASPVGTSRDTVLAIAPDGHGNTVAIAKPSPDGPAYLEWLDGSAAVLRSVALDALPAMLLVSWNTGHVLVLTELAPQRARWYDAVGAPITPWFPAGFVSAATGFLHLLVDGTIALSNGDAWVASFRDGVAAMDPPPSWLAARPATRLATIRGGRGYALLPLPLSRGPAPDESALEIVTPAGDSCGTVQLPAAPDEPGVARTPVIVDVGEDGTVIQNVARDGAALGAGHHCEFRWWPALLR